MAHMFVGLQEGSVFKFQVPTTAQGLVAGL